VTTLKSLIATAALCAMTPAFGGGHDACLGCHEPDAEFKGMSADSIAAAIKDAGIRPHKKFSGLSDEEIQAIANALAAG
jgi:cytochrome c551/c552